MSMLSAPYFHDESAAFAKLESLLWPNGPVCPHCKGTLRITDVRGKTARMGLKRCGVCKKQFTVTVGTVFERSHIPLHQWLQAAFLLCSSKKGFSAHQLHRVLGITYKSAWFMAHRLREAMRSSPFDLMGGNGGSVEIDETFIGNNPELKKKGDKKRSYHHKFAVLTLVDRTTGEARSFKIEKASRRSIEPIVRANLSREARMITDEAFYYRRIGKQQAEHASVNHRAGEYGRGEVHTNTIEGFFSIFKRGMKGVYQHCGEQHLHRYLAEFDIRYNTRDVTDSERADAMLKSIVGKRLTYGGPRQPEA